MSVWPYLQDVPTYVIIDVTHVIELISVFKHDTILNKMGILLESYFLANLLYTLLVSSTYRKKVEIQPNEQICD